LREYYDALKFAIKKLTGKKRTDKTITRQQRKQLRAWQELQYSLGKCPDCGEPCDFNKQTGRLYSSCKQCRKKYMADLESVLSRNNAACKYE
jgi:hypothetical protein